MFQFFYKLHFSHCADTKLQNFLSIFFLFRLFIRVVYGFKNLKFINSLVSLFTQLILSKAPISHNYHLRRSHVKLSLLIIYKYALFVSYVFIGSIYNIIQLFPASVLALLNNIMEFELSSLVQSMYFLMDLIFCWNNIRFSVCDAIVVVADIYHCFYGLTLCSDFGWAF